MMMFERVIDVKGLSVEFSRSMVIYVKALVGCTYENVYASVCVLLMQTKHIFLG